MAPGFLSKLVKTPGGHSREQSHGTPSKTSARGRNGTISSADVPNIVIDSGGAPDDTESGLNVNVTVVPPSPMTNHEGLPSIDDDLGYRSGYASDGRSVKSKKDKGSIRASRVVASEAPPTTLLKKRSSSPLTKAAKQHTPLPPPLPVRPAAAVLSSPAAIITLPQQPYSTNMVVPPTMKVTRTAPTLNLEMNHYTNGHGSVNGNGHGNGNGAGTPPAIYTPDEPIVDSPTEEVTRSFSEIPSTRGRGLSDAGSTAGMASAMSSPPAKKPKTKSTGPSGWRSSKEKKPTGLAAALAASGMAMANASMGGTVQHHHPSAPAVLQPIPTLSPRSDGRRVMSLSEGAALNSASTTGSHRHSHHHPHPRRPTSSQGSRSNHGRRGSMVPSVSGRSNNGDDARSNSEYAPFSDQSPSHSAYNSEFDSSSASGSGSGSEDGSNSDDDLLDSLDFEGQGGAGMMPVTGFAVASSRRNADFHEMFPSVPEGDYLIEDYGCALQREILIQGRLYISENHVCFHSNIFGWVTDLSIPISEIVTLEKKMTAYVIPNAIQLATRQTKYAFSSFLSRDTTYDVIYNVWRLVRPDAAAAMAARIRENAANGRSGASLVQGRSGMDAVREKVVLPIGDANGSVPGASPAKEPGKVRKATFCQCGKDGKHFSETAMDIVLPGTPDRIHNLIFASGFIKDFLKDNQKLLDLQISDWTPSPTTNLPSRNLSYIKPLNNSMGPKQTKCEIKDETIHADFDDYASTLTTTRTPDVPSGSVFSVKTRTCVTWAGPVSTRVLVTTEVEWTGRSFIKGIINSSCIDGQKVYHKDLENAMRAYISAHQSEFIPEGIDLDSVEAAAATPLPMSTGNTGAASADSTTAVDDARQKEKERNARGLQWAWETFEGASSVAVKSTKGALSLIKETWDHSTLTTICIFLIIGLVFSNIWTLTIVGSRKGEKKASVRGRGGRGAVEEKEKWVQGIVQALWDEMHSGKIGGTSKEPPTLRQLEDHATSPASADPSSQPPSLANWKEEVAGLKKTLADLEERVRTLREGLNGLD